MTRLFVAVWPPEPVAAALAALDVRPEPGVRPVAPENWHVTLRFLGDTDPDTVIERLAGADLPPACAVLGPAVERLGRNALVVPVSGVDELAAKIRETTADLGQPAQPRFRGHLTVARTRRDAPSAAIGTPFDAAFDVGEIALVDSRLTPDGARYTTRAVLSLPDQG